MHELGIVVKAIRVGLKDNIQNILPPEQVDRVIGGKMLRGVLVILIAEALSDKKYIDKALDLAAAVEVTHSCSLDVDDALDDDKTRRGKKALYLTLSKKEMMMDTIYRLAIPYGLVCRYGKDYVEKAAECQEGMSKGVLDEMKHVLTKKELPATIIYRDILTKKTGLLFSLSSQFGAMAADADEKTVECFRQYGLSLGIAYQQGDDIADLQKVIQGEKSWGTEKLLLRAVQADELLKELKEDVKMRRLRPTKAFELMNDGALQLSMMDMVNTEIDKAIDAIAEIDIEEHYKSFLREYPRFCVESILKE